MNGAKSRNPRLCDPGDALQGDMADEEIGEGGEGDAEEEGAQVIAARFKAVSCRLYAGDTPGPEPAFLESRDLEGQPEADGCPDPPLRSFPDAPVGAYNGADRGSPQWPSAGIGYKVPDLMERGPDDSADFDEGKSYCYQCSFMIAGCFEPLSSIPCACRAPPCRR